MDIGRIILRLVFKSGNRSNVQSTQGIYNASDYPSLDLAFDLVKERIKSQLARIDGLDSKANFISGAGIGILGVDLTLQALQLPPAHHSYCSDLIPPFIRVLLPIPKHTILIGLLVIAFIMVMIFSHLAYRLRQYKDVPANPEGLFKRLKQNLVETKLEMYDRMIVSVNENEEKIEKKANRIDWAFIFLYIEIFAF